MKSRQSTRIVTLALVLLLVGAAYAQDGGIDQALLKKFDQAPIKVADWEPFFRALRNLD